MNAAVNFPHEERSALATVPEGRENRVGPPTGATGGSTALCRRDVLLGPCQPAWPPPRLRSSLLSVRFGKATEHGLATRIGSRPTPWCWARSRLMELKYAFTRPRPTQTDDPNRWFRGKGNQSFPSGEVTEITTAITPFVLEYGREYRRSGRSSCCLSTTRSRASRSGYDAIARVKVRAHWQSDVLAIFAIGTAIGAYAYSRS